MARRGAALRASLIAVTVAVVSAAAQVRIGWLLANRAAQARADASPSRTPGEAPAGQLTRRGLGGLFSAHRVAAAAGDGRSSAGTLRLACPRRALRSPKRRACARGAADLHGRAALHVQAATAQLDYQMRPLGSHPCAPLLHLQLAPCSHSRAHNQHAHTTHHKTQHTQAQTEQGDPGGSYRAAYGYVLCDPGTTVSPKSTADVALAVKQALGDAARDGKALKIRASRHKFHTTTSLACPDQQYAFPGTPPANGSAGAAPANGGGSGGGVHSGVLALAVLHDNMDRVLEHDPVKFTMTVGAGMRVNQLLPEATRLNMSVMVSHLLLSCSYLTHVTNETQFVI